MALAVGWYLTFDVGLGSWASLLMTEVNKVWLERRQLPGDLHDPHLLPTDPKGTLGSAAAFAVGMVTASLFSWLRESYPAPGFTGWAQLCPFIHLQRASFHLRCELLAMLAGCWPRALQAPTLLLLITRRFSPTSGVCRAIHLCLKYGHIFTVFCIISLLAIFTIQRRASVCLKVN